MTQPANNLWLVSFGDLLTLLLCLFIAQFQVMKDSSQLTTRNKTVNTSLSLKKQNGTQLANHKNKDIELIVPLASKDFELNSEGIQQNPNHWLQAIDIPKGFVAKEMNVSLCREGFRDKAWGNANRVALAVKSQLIGTPYSSTLMSYEIFGTGCKDVVDTKKFIGRIKIVLKKFIKNG